MFNDKDLNKSYDQVVFERSFNLDKTKKQILEGDFSYKAARKKLFEAASNKLLEAAPESMFGQLTRYGVQVIADQWYQRIPVSYEQYVGKVTSKSRQEFYAPMFRGELAGKVGENEKFPEGQVKGNDIMIVNQKFGKIFSFSRELFTDDQTGQIAQRAQQIGEDMRLIEDIYATGRLTGSAFAFGSVKVDAPNYKTVDASGNVVSSVYAAALGNLNVAGGLLSQALLESSEIALTTMVDPLGNPMLVVPNTLIVGPKDMFNAMKLLKSTDQPSIPGVAPATVSTSVSGTTGWTNTVNVLFNRYNLVMNRYLTQLGTDGVNEPWFLGEAKKGLIQQVRDTMEVQQEAPNSGESFNTDAYRYRGRARWETDWIESRFWYRGN